MVFFSKKKEQKQKYKVTIQGQNKKYIEIDDDLKNAVETSVRYAVYGMVTLPVYISIEKL